MRRSGAGLGMIRRSVPTKDFRFRQLSEHRPGSAMSAGRRPALTYATSIRPAATPAENAEEPASRQDPTGRNLATYGDVGHQGEIAGISLKWIAGMSGVEGMS